VGFTRAAAQKEKTLAFLSPSSQRDETIGKSRYHCALVFQTVRSLILCSLPEDSRSPSAVVTVIVTSFLRRIPGSSADTRFGCRRVRRHNRTAPFLYSTPHGVKHLQVFVRDNNVDQALRMLKRKLQREGLFREMKRRRFYEKPSERSTRERSESVRRHRKLLRKKAIHDGLIAAPKKLDRPKDARAPAPSHARVDRPR
jgi:small subunit ribosomal protein S21